MRRKKERSKRGQTNKQGKATHHVQLYMLMRDAEGRKKEASKAIQRNAKQHSTPKAVTFLKKNEMRRVEIHVYMYM